jgi:hypothetical protein
MNLGRKLERGNLKEKLSQCEQTLRKARHDNIELANQVEHLQEELLRSRDVINALALADIRNNNYTCDSDNYRNNVVLPYSYLAEVHYNYTCKIKHDKETLIIEPVKNVKEEGAWGGEKGKDSSSKTDNKGTDTETNQEKH